MASGAATVVEVGPAVVVVPSELPPHAARSRAMTPTAERRRILLDIVVRLSAAWNCVLRQYLVDRS